MVELGHQPQFLFLPDSIFDALDGVSDARITLYRYEPVRHTTICEQLPRIIGRAVCLVVSFERGVRHRWTDDRLSFNPGL
ncbi:hypothetical protein C475_02246 [Halosimplex carlsbadense 2-9-1]|uniref:Uncharacterized protein n=1 Tax=Halosimplex carlsbadense 2-9-1 TaxID=797114 RepID=M0D2Q0_9EURY|nr:hypothetical protein C475_02246 [Halosimplex carlsbadense 2-9-1]